ncbi:MAG: nitrate- and nitrite sensing domain-containing protein, partial [Trebonia sp.]
MIAVPLVSLVALYAFSAALTVPNAIKDSNYNSTTTADTSPAVTTLSTELPAERADTYIWLLSGGKASKAQLLSVRATVSKVLPAAAASFRVGQQLLSPNSLAEQNAFLAGLGQIDAIRAKADGGSLTPAAAFNAYSGILDAEFASYRAATTARGGSSLGVTSVGALNSAYSLEMASREAALAGGAFAASKGVMSPSVRGLFIASAANRQQLLNEATALLSGDLLAGYTSFIQSATYKQFVTMESAISASNGALPVNAATWTSVSGAYLENMAKIQEANGVRLAAAGAASSNRLFTEAVLAGGVGLAAVAVSIFLMLWFGRRVTRDLSGLYSSVRTMAEERLPRVVDRLRRGEDVDVAAESPTPSGSGIREISQIARSFGTVQEAAVSAAVEQAQLRKGVNQVFLNI